MNRYFVLLLTACLASSALAKDNPPLDPVVTGNTAFALDLYGQLRSAKGNLFFSPYSLSTALAMTYAGARGQTAKQMAKTLHFSLPQDQLHPALGALQHRLNDLQQKGHLQLAIANSLWPQQDYELLPSFLGLCRKQYGVGISPLDYVGAAEQARQRINSWVESKTNNKILDLIKPGLLDANTRLVLANAVYFKGDWARPFAAQATTTAPFQTGTGKTVQAPLMHNKARYRYAETEQWQALELPYAGDALSMLVLLPRKADGLGDLETQLSPARWTDWTGRLRPVEVDVFLPKFKMNAEFSLAETLTAMGMPDAFAPGRADLTGMTQKPELYLSAVVHKAFVEVNEKGTEAAAATGVMISVTSVMLEEEPKVFRADHPFLFLIRDNQTGSLLFLGRVSDPSQQ